MIDWMPGRFDSGKPRYLAIADAIAKDISAGRLSSGDRLPPQRKLASALGIDFTTVSRAYSEAQTRGLVDSHVGRGTFVAGTLASAAPDPARALAEDLSMNMPPEPTEQTLTDKMRGGLAYVSANLVDLLRYQSAIGAVQDRAAASGWLEMRGLDAQLERITVTPGAHATMAAILSIITRPNDKILCERITYPGLRNIAGRFGVELIGLDMDKDGITPEALDAAIVRHRPKALYLNPTLHNPTTLTIPVGRRLELAKILRKHDLTLIEDDAYGFVPANAPAPIAHLVPNLTWYIGGLSKCIGAGLRLAYTVAPTAKCAYQLAQAIRAISVMPSPISMALATQWIEDGTADDIRDFIRAESVARQSIAAKALEGFRFQTSEYAFNIWLSLPKGIGRADIVARLAGRQLGVMPSDAFTVSGTADEKLRVCLGGSISRETLRENLCFLASALSENAYMG